MKTGSYDGSGRLTDFRDDGRTIIIEEVCNGVFVGNVRIWFLQQGKQIDYYEGSYGGYQSPGVPRTG